MDAYLGSWVGICNIKDTGGLFALNYNYRSSPRAHLAESLLWPSFQLILFTTIFLSSMSTRVTLVPNNRLFLSLFSKGPASSFFSHFLSSYVGCALFSAFSSRDTVVRDVRCSALRYLSRIECLFSIAYRPVAFVFILRSLTTT